MLDSKIHRTAKTFHELGFLFHRLNGEESHSIHTCLVCEKNEFYVNLISGTWDCKKCDNFNGDRKKFFTTVLKMFESTDEDIKRIVKTRWNVEDRTALISLLKSLEIGYYPIEDCFLIPMYLPSEKGYELSTLQKYKIGNKVNDLTGGKHGAYILGDITKNSTIWIVEGLWDSITLKCLIPTACVIGIAGSRSFPTPLTKVLKDKDVITYFHNENESKKGFERVKELLDGVVNSLSYVNHTKDDKCDLNDMFNTLKLDEVIAYLANIERVSIQSCRDTVNIDADVDEGTNDLNTINADEIYGEWCKWLCMKDVDVLDVLYGGYFACRMFSDQIWMFLVAPPGGSKSELLMSYKNDKYAITLTSLSKSALISGFGGKKKDHSLLPKLNKKMLIVKDFTAVLASGEANREEIFGLLRDVYDGESQKHFGNGSKSYKSKFGIIAGVTPIIDAYMVRVSALGERFLKYHLTHDDEDELIRRAIGNIGKENTMREALVNITNRVLTVKMNPKFIDEVKLTPEMIAILGALAKTVGMCRAIVVRDNNDLVTCKPPREVATRLAKQLCNLMYGIMYYRKLREVNDKVLRIIRRVAHDTIPELNREVLKYIFRNPGKNVGDIGDAVKLPWTTVYHMLEDFKIIGLIQNKGDNKEVFEWELTKETSQIFELSGIFKQ